MKKLCLIILTVLIIMSFPAGSMAASKLPVYKVNGVIYFFDKSSGTITGFAGSPKDVVLPDALGGYRVLCIGNKAFAGAYTLNSLSIPYGVVSIGDSAFYNCTNLKSVEIAESVEHIGNGAFQGCNSLSNVIFKGRLEDIADDAFYGVPWLSDTDSEFIILGGLRLIKYNGVSETVYVPEGVTEVSSNAFAYNNSIKQVILPEGLRAVGSNAFLQCNNLESIYIPSTVSSIGIGAFDDTKWIRAQGEFVNVNGILVSYNGSSMKVDIPYGFTGIGSGAFLSNDYIKSVNLPSSVIYIDSMAFADCNNLIGIQIPQSVEWIDDWAFSGCGQITLYGVPDSYAQAYALSKNIRFSSEVHVSLNDMPIEALDVLPIIYYERAYVPLRAVLEQLGYSVTWNMEDNSVYIKKDEETVIIQSDGTITANGSQIATVSSPLYINGHMMISVRIIAESIGANVEWNENTRTVNIIQK